MSNATRSEWQKTTLGEICNMRAGVVFPKALQGRNHGKYPFAKVSDMNLPENSIFIENANNWVDDDDIAALRAKPFPPETVIFAKIGEGLKQNRIRFLIKPTLIDNNMMGATPISSKVDPRFFFYALSQIDFGEIAVGTALPYLTVSFLSKIELPLPPLPAQRAIARALGALDDKIALNARMNATLEAIARALFQAWFVDFEPVRAKRSGRWQPDQTLPGMPAQLYPLFPNELTPTDLGDIPTGWQPRALGEIGDIVTGKTPSTRNPRFYGNDVPFLKIPDMRNKMYVAETATMLSNQGAASQPKKALPAGSVSVSCIATPGLVVLNHRETHTNQQINSIVPYTDWVSKYLYWACRHISNEIMIRGSGGTVFVNLNKSNFSTITILYPKDEVIQAFDELVTPFHDAILSNQKQSLTLAALRDTLLPPLLSGEIRID